MAPAGLNVAGWLAAIRVRGIRRIRSSSGGTLHTCSKNTTNLELERLHFAHVFEKYSEFGDPAAAICTRVRGIRRIRSSSGSALHTCSRNTTNSELKRLHFAHVFEKYDEFGARAPVLCTRVREIQQLCFSRPSSGFFLLKNVGFIRFWTKISSPGDSQRQGWR